MSDTELPTTIKRVCVIGAGGSGKSTFSIELSNITNLPVQHLDKLFWEENWVERDKGDFKKLHDEWIREEHWIIDGNGYDSMSSRLDRADTIIFLDYSRILSILSATHRAIKFRGTARPMMQKNCNEKIDINFLKFLIYIWNYNKIMKPKMLDLIRTKKNKNVKIFKNRLKASDWLETLKQSQLN